MLPIRRVVSAATLVCGLLAGDSVIAAEQVPVPVIDGPWWQIAGDPDLGVYTRDEQQPVDFGIWQAADGSWQLWSCIRGTGCGQFTRLFYRWEGKQLTDRDWNPRGMTTFGSGNRLRPNCSSDIAIHITTTEKVSSLSLGWS